MSFDTNILKKMNSNKKNISVLLLLSLLSFIVLNFSSCSCNRSKDFERAIAKSDLEKIQIPPVRIARYEADLFKLPKDSLKQGLQKLQKKYSFFYSTEDLENPAKLFQIRSYVADPIITKLYNETSKQYPDLSFLEKDLTQAFRRIAYFVPGWKTPAVYTYISGGDFEYPVKYANDNLVIALDMYLGEKYPMYEMWGIPKYVSRRMNRNNLVIDCVREIGRAEVEKRTPNPKTLLERMVYEGKVLYFSDIILPETDDSLKINYSGPQLYWAEKNQGNVWGFFMEKKLLHSSDFRQINKFSEEAPFTSAFSKNSAPRVAAYIGWQIVRAYMAKNKETGFIDLTKLTDAQQVLNKSQYKPVKTK